MEHGVTVVGTGTASAPPDLLRLEIGAESVAPSPQEALSAAGAALDRMRGALRDGGVDQADLTSGPMWLWPRYEEKGRLGGYTAELRLAARIRDLAATGELIGRTVAAGGIPARLHGMSFEHSQPARLREAARQAAWLDAQASARQYAELAGRVLGPVLAVVEAPTRGPIQPVELRGAMAMAAESVPVEPGQAEVEVRVEIRYGFSDATDRA